MHLRPSHPARDHAARLTDPLPSGAMRAPLVLVAEAAAEPPVAVFLGDSWVEGTGADTAQVMFAQQVADTFGWQLVNGGQGGTGYLDEGPPEFPERGPIGERVAETVAAGPDIVIVAAGINDTGDGYASEEVTAAVTGALQALRDQLPGVPVVVVGPWWPNGFPTESAEMVDRVVTDVATALGLPFVSPMAEQWITGSNDGTVPGNREEFIGPDGAHPSQAGHDYLAQKLVAWLQTVPGLPLGV